VTPYREPPGLVDCREHGPGSGAELFVVEGESAALAVTAVRDPRLQAVLPMQGKPLNPLKATAGKVATYPFYRRLIDALGVGWGAAFDLRSLRYERVVLLMDPDADGIHCGALLTLFFHRWLPALLEGGHLLMGRAPVGEIVAERGESPCYAYGHAEFLAMCARAARADGIGARTQRYRGLAGIDAVVLARSCVDPTTRLAHPLTPADAEAARAVFAPSLATASQSPLL
jgi:DNA gyrase subunit B/topoisomerase-4 subunit B